MNRWMECRSKFSQQEAQIRLQYFSVYDTIDIRDFLKMFTNLCRRSAKLGYSGVVKIFTATNTIIDVYRVFPSCINHLKIKCDMWYQKADLSEDGIILELALA